VNQVGSFYKYHESLNIMSVATVMVMKLRIKRMTATCKCVLRVPERNLFNDRRESSKVNRWHNLLIVKCTSSLAAFLTAVADSGIKGSSPR
jgi:hypothetical protein